MKLLVVSLALLTIFAGSQAFFIRYDSDYKVDEYGRKLLKCLERLFDAFSKNGVMAVEAAIGEPMSSRIIDTEEKVRERLRVVGDAFPPEVEEIKQQATSALWAAKWRLEDDVETLRRNLTHETWTLERALAADLNPFLEKLDPYLQPLLQNLSQECAGLNEKLTEMLKPTVEKLQPRAEKIQEQLREAEEALDPLVGHVQKIIISEVEGAREALKQVATRVLEVFNRYREDFDRWARTPLFAKDQ